MPWQGRSHPDAREERRKLPLQERPAMANAMETLKVHGPVLPCPHSSDVRGADRSRELRPRAGPRSRRRRHEAPGMPSEEQIVADVLRDRLFHAGWDRERFARKVANRVIGYRAGHRLSQTALARLPGIKQPPVARLEAGDVTRCG